jgi:hypothetical protein
MKPKLIVIQSLILFSCYHQLGLPLVEGKDRNVLNVVFFSFIIIIIIIIIIIKWRIENWGHFSIQYRYIYIYYMYIFCILLIYIQNDIIFNLFVCLKHCLGIWTLCTCASVQRPDTFTVYILSVRLLFNHIHRDSTTTSTTSYTTTTTISYMHSFPHFLFCYTL